MPRIQPAFAANRLLKALPRSDLRRMLGGCESVELAFADVLYSPGERISHVYFPMRSFISLVMSVDDSACVEVGLIGNEGMFGTPLALGVYESPLRAVVQGAGSAIRMEAASFCFELRRSQALQSEIHRYTFVRMNHLAQAAACTRFHMVEARLARWLLMTQDRAHADTFRITHEFLAFMLGVRRVGVTKAATSLQQRGLIRYSRGNITVLDRRGLKSASCGCYQSDLESYDRILDQPLRVNADVQWGGRSQ